MKGLDVGYGALCHRFDQRQVGSINSSTGAEGVLGVERCTKRKRIALSSGQNHLSPKNPATKIMTTTTPMR
jgi:hypothetical protein